MTPTCPYLLDLIAIVHEAAEASAPQWQGRWHLVKGFPLKSLKYGTSSKLHFSNLHEGLLYIAAHPTAIEIPDAMHDAAIMRHFMRQPVARVPT